MAKTRRSINKGHKPQTPDGKPLSKLRSKLPIFLVLGGALILIIAAFFAFQKKPSSFTPEVTGRPNLTADKTSVDLGDEKLGNPVEVSFELKNTGDRPLQFSKAPYIELIEGC
jgi:hypothetical protein